MGQQEYASNLPLDSGSNGGSSDDLTTIQDEVDTLQSTVNAKAPKASPTLTGTVTATAINAGASPASLTISTTDNTSGSTGDMLFATGNASVAGSGSGAFLFAEGNSLGTKGIRVYNKDAGINYGYTQMDYTGIRMPNNGNIITQVVNNSFYVGSQNGSSGFSFGHENGINTRGNIVDGPGDTYYIGGEFTHGIYPFKRLYIGSGGAVFGAPVSDAVTYDPINTVDIRGGAGTSYAQFTNTATGSTAGDGLLVGLDATGKAVITNQENRPITLSGLATVPQRATLSNGGSATISDGVSLLFLHGTGTAASYTVTLTANPIDGQIVIITSDQIVTTLTITPNSGQTLVPSISTMSPSAAIRLVYDLTHTQWMVA